MHSQDVSALTPLEVLTPAQTLRGWAIGEAADSDHLPVLFVHPINLQGLAWAQVATVCRRFCLLPDMRGHGLSTANGPFGVDAWVEDLLAVLDRFDVARCHVVGGSLGGTLAVALADRAPERVASIAAFGSTLAPAGDDLEAVLDALRDNGVRKTFEHGIPEMSVAPGTPADVVSAIVDMTNPNDVPTVSAVWRATIDTDITGLAAGVTVPALVVTGEFDRTCPPDQGRAMAAQLNAPFVPMPGIGHLPMMEAPGATAALVRDFLSRVEDGQGSL
ncbi:alpha/beta fold hydrolase [Mycobacterium sp. NPDC051198]